MAARKTKHLSADWRMKIQTSMLLNRLNNFVNGKVELSPAQVTAALGLLKKSLPDLSAVDHQMLDKDGKKASGFKIEIEHVKAR